MTEPVKSVAKTGGLDRRSATQEKLRRLYTESGENDDAAADDMVDISEEARKRASGSWKKDILEYLEDDE